MGFRVYGLSRCQGLIHLKDLYLRAWVSRPSGSRVDCVPRRPRKNELVYMHSVRFGKRRKGLFRHLGDCTCIVFLSFRQAQVVAKNPEP